MAGAAPVAGRSERAFENALVNASATPQAIADNEVSRAQWLLAMLCLTNAFLVLDVAARGTGIERQAAVYALGFFGRDLPDAVLRQLMASDDVQVRFSAFELATRRDGVRFARESMEFVRSFVKDVRGGAPSHEQERAVGHLPRILARLARGPLPPTLLDGLKEQDPVLRRIVVVALELGGNPDAVPYLEPLLNDPEAPVRNAARSAVTALGPEVR